MPDPTVHHINAGLLHAPPSPQASCHCLLVQTHAAVVLVDAGIGLQDIAQPDSRIGREAIKGAGFKFHEDNTAHHQTRRLGIHPASVTDIALTHADPDHAGGLADFPHATAHVAAAEREALDSDDPRYSKTQFDHGPRWRVHDRFENDWFGLPASPLGIDGAELLLVALPGHTRGHCGVAVRAGQRWAFHVGDAYYLRAELTQPDHPVSALAALRAADDPQRLATLETLRTLLAEHAGSIDHFGYHDFTEFPEPPQVVGLEDPVSEPKRRSRSDVLEAHPTDGLEGF